MSDPFDQRTTSKPFLMKNTNNDIAWYILHRHVAY